MGLRRDTIKVDWDGIAELLPNTLPPRIAGDSYGSLAALAAGQQLVSTPSEHLRLAIQTSPETKGAAGAELLQPLLPPKPVAAAAGGLPGGEDFEAACEKELTSVYQRMFKVGVWG